MKCNELMVGDWVTDEHGIPMQVISVGYTYAYAENVYDYDWEEFEDKECKPYPILLTKEFFKRNNFDEDVLYWADGKDVYLIAIRMNNTSTGPCANVHYVHELQQLLRLGGYTELANNVKLPNND